MRIRLIRAFVLLVPYQADWLANEIVFGGFSSLWHNSFKDMLWEDQNLEFFQALTFVLVVLFTFGIVLWMSKRKK